MADDRQAALNAIDLKGNIVLKEFGDTALLFRPQNNYEPFVVAYGYDKAAGEWSHGSYHTDLGHAFEEANPEIIDAYLRPGVLEADNGQIGLSDMVDELRESARGSSRDAVSRDISHGGEAI